MWPVFQEDWAEVSCYFDGPAASTRAYALQEPIRGVEGSLTEEWDWIHLDGDGSSEMTIIQAGMEGSIYDPMERLDEIRAWMLKNLSELKTVFDPPFNKTPA